MPLNPAPTIATRISMSAYRPPVPALTIDGDGSADRLRLSAHSVAAARSRRLGDRPRQRRGHRPGSKPPRVNGFVVAMQRRRVFVGVGRIGEIGSDGARLRRGSVNTRPFQLREGELLLAGEADRHALQARAGRRRRAHAVARRPRLGGRDGRAGGRAPGAAAAAFAETCSTGRRPASCSPPNGRSTARRPSSATCTRPRWPMRSASCRSAAGGCLPESSRTSASPTCWRSSPRRTRSDSSRGSTLERLARVLDEMDADDAADLLGEFTPGRQAELLQRDGPRGGRASSAAAQLSARHRRRADDARAGDPGARRDRRRGAGADP